MAGVELSTRVCDGHAVAALCGELDCVYAADAEAAITALTARGQSLIIRMLALDFMDCSSLSVLLRVQRLARQVGGDMVLAAPQRQPRRLLALTGKDHAFCVHPSVEAAVASTGGRRTRYHGQRPAVNTARLGGQRHAYWYRVIAPGAAAERQGDLPVGRALLAGSLRGPVRG